MSRSVLNCSKVKDENQKPKKKLQPLDIPLWTSDQITMDFITNFPRTLCAQDTIQVIVDRLTQIAHLIAIQESSSTKKLVYIYVREVVPCHGVLVSSVSNWDVRSTSRFMKIFHDDFGTQLHLNTTYHVEIDEQIEDDSYLRGYAKGLCYGFWWEMGFIFTVGRILLQQSFHLSIGMHLFEMLYKRKYWTTIFWGEFGQRVMGSTDVVLKTTELTQQTRWRLQTMQSHCTV